MQPKSLQGISGEKNKIVSSTIFLHDPPSLKICTYFKNEDTSFTEDVKESENKLQGLRSRAG